MSPLDDAAELAKTIQEVLRSGFGIDARAVAGTPEHSTIDVWAPDGRYFVITVSGLSVSEYNKRMD
jgi:hypothetical protein